MKFKFFVLIVFATLLFPSAKAFSLSCDWVAKDGSTKQLEFFSVIRNGTAEKDIDQFHNCCLSLGAACSHQTTSPDNYRLITLAAKNNMTTVVKYLLKYQDWGQYPKDIDEFKLYYDGVERDPFNALMYAIKYRNQEMVEWLLFYKSDPTVRNYLDKDAKYYAEQLDSKDTVNAKIIDMVVTAWKKTLDIGANIERNKKKDLLMKSLNGQSVRDAIDRIKANHGLSLC